MASDADDSGYLHLPNHRRTKHIISLTSQRYFQLARLCTTQVFTATCWRAKRTSWPRSYTSSSIRHRGRTAHLHSISIWTVLVSSGRFPFSYSTRDDGFHFSPNHYG